MRETVKRDQHRRIVDQRAQKSAIYRKTFARTLQQVDLAMLVREMHEEAGLTLRTPNTAATRLQCWSASPRSVAWV